MELLIDLRFDECRVIFRKSIIIDWDYWSNLLYFVRNVLDHPVVWLQKGPLLQLIMPLHNCKGLVVFKEELGWHNSGAVLHDIAYETDAYLELFCIAEFDQSRQFQYTCFFKCRIELLHNFRTLHESREHQDGQHVVLGCLWIFIWIVLCWDALINDLVQLLNHVCRRVFRHLTVESKLA